VGHSALTLYRSRGKPSRRRKRVPAGGPYELIEAIELPARSTFDFRRDA